ncbi:hypothetical protein GLOTRDRAFT_112193 [Gloeophyllum trabeum ATCC 11539]|uniref:Uncharacterized protein n=1 Tax=Gloeophyllum trabeum (strain ATCC 11539 / FP-39264 / Madison 617) TaxID=670483 RepID=S7PX55_GLOTA|nr:uncharacterized protein GLOTRDRAFT_112193 [Gloeophyllum trabeum ATCC 11539]EPQ52181.1 hypothetical protein GLOTRDRAFT_112193 [Gloeophyllum trabeum ATCC 11539]
MGIMDTNRPSQLLTRRPRGNMIVGASALAAVTAGYYYLRKAGDAPDSREYPLSWIGCHLSWRDPDAKPNFNTNLRREGAGAGNPS